MSTPTPTKQNSNTADNLLSQAQEPSSAIQDWRANVLNIFLPLASIAIFPAVVQTVMQAISNPWIAWQGAAIFLYFYLVLIFITVRRDLSATKRSWIVIALIYLTGIVSMARGGLAGDGTTYLVVLPILSITLINARTGIFATGVSLST